MGVDVSSILAFGTEDEEVGKKITELLSSTDENDEPIQYYISGDIGEEHIKDLTPEQQEIVNDFLGFELWENCYDGSFEGFGIEASPNNFSEEDKKPIVELFNKYNLGEPSWVSFSHWW